MFIAVLKALPQFLSFLLTLLRGDKAPMSGQTSTFGKRLSNMVMIGLAIGTVILYLDYTKEVETSSSLTKEVAKLKKEGVESPEGKKKLRDLQEKVTNLEIKLSALERDRANLITENDDLAAQINKLKVELEAAQRDLHNCKTIGNSCTTDTVPKPETDNQSMADLIKQLDKIGKDKDND